MSASSSEALLELLISRFSLAMAEEFRTKLPYSRAFARYCSEVNMNGLSEETIHHYSVSVMDIVNTIWGSCKRIARQRPANSLRQERDLKSLIERRLMII